MANTSATTSKVVYILGAGFSKPAGAPSQGEILREIFALQEPTPRIIKARESLRRFLVDDLHVRESDIENVALEDIYTPIDRCISDGTSFKSKTYSDLGTLRSHIEHLISRAIDSTIRRKLEGSPNATSYIREFAEHMVKKASHRAVLAREANAPEMARRYDPFSIISLNWDILLDNALQDALLRDCPMQGDYDPFGVVDYCCYVSSLERDDTRVRAGLWSLGCRGYNVKLLKLHGSMNWLQCPNCQRLYVSFGEKGGMLDNIGKTQCRHCEWNGHHNPLQGSLVMPTFLKDLSNFQIKLVWQNAGVELMEARRLVFIGYSLPHADFEFRQLLSRMIHRDATVDVVLFKGTSKESEQAFEAERNRYRQFFSGHKIGFHPRGVVEFVAKMRG